MSDKNNKLKIKDTLDDLLENSTNNNKDSNSTNISIGKSPKKLNKIIITRSAYRKMIIIAQEVSKLLNQSMEVYALCIGDNGIIEDILIPPQNVSSISIHINASDILSLVPNIRKNNLNIIGWVHSHGDMSAFFSSTDDRNQITVLNDTSNYSEVGNIRVKYCFGITVNLREELFGIVTTQFPSSNIIHERAIFEIRSFFPPDWNENEIRNEISAELKDKIRKGRISHKNHNTVEFANNYDEDSEISKFEDKNLLSSRDRYLISLFLKRNNFSNPKIKKLLFNFVRFLNINKNWTKETKENKENKENLENKVINDMKINQDKKENQDE
ncbi:Mov34/MPN/PAD-1 family protein [Promethearchaeum syntrophicum]|uniref:Mov34/MPN/PAD-1 family protein n=1 Tax=Promethearchaeum syntrophicum TaxID=2594042 RepID=A0A5B9D8N2_9ARCH|nr:Mov34/MPN/PAD-1 family protein [Candidatus Prometheoarchaeum syntrophicum]QEE15130.1 hypothetical protein DSAG12_00953 [Candidatus Prometheoarchaeum syntrophicum]